VLIVDGTIIAAAQEERFTRKKHDASFPHHALDFVLSQGRLKLEDLSALAFYEKPYLKFERLIETYHSFAPRGLSSFLTAIPVWIKEKLFMKEMLRKELKMFGSSIPPLYFTEHHFSHAASAFFPSPFEQAAIITIDGVGEWVTTTIGKGGGNAIKVLRELSFPHSLGLLYSAFTYFCGFKVNSGEYKLMGLAPYGNHRSAETERFKDIIRRELVDIREDGSLLLNMNYFDYATGMRMVRDAQWKWLFGIPRRNDNEEISQSYMNLSLAIQEITEEIVLRLARTARKLTGCDNLVLAGGVALNCVANGKLLRSGIFKDIWVQPAAGDAGGALGAALGVWHIVKNNPRKISSPAFDAMQGAYLGVEFSNEQIRNTALNFDAPHKEYQLYDELCADVASLLAQGKIVGWFQGKMEFGQRSLGNRSILADPRDPEIQKKLNLKIKFREGFRPFAPSVLEEDCGEYFDLDRPSPYMLFVAPVIEGRRRPLPEDYSRRDLYERLYHIRSDVPAITHIDFSARVQTVSSNTNLRYWRLISAFKKLTGIGILVNTSFNVRGEPIVCTPEDAYLCFMHTNMDLLVLGDYLFIKDEQPPLGGSTSSKRVFEPD
jgi:carbamoyltransferase